MSDTSHIVATGQVVRDGAGRMWIDVPRRSACQSCGKASGCGMSVLGGLSGNSPLRLSVDGLNRAPGEHVALSCAASGLLKAAFLAYGLTVLGLVAGGVAPALLGLGDGWQALGAALGLGLGILITRWAVARGHIPALTLTEE